MGLAGAGVARTGGSGREDRLLFAKGGGELHLGTVADDFQGGLGVGGELGDGDPEVFRAGNRLVIDGNDDIARFQSGGVGG